MKAQSPHCLMSVSSDNSEHPASDRLSWRKATTVTEPHIERIHVTFCLFFFILYMNVSGEIALSPAE